MRWLWLAAILLLAASAGTTCSITIIVRIPGGDADPLYRFEKGDHVGFIDRTGHVIGSTFSIFAWDFHSGLVKIGYPDGTYADKTGKIVIQGFEGGQEFSEGLAAVQLHRNDPWGYIDTTGKLAIPPKFKASPGAFLNGLPGISVNGKTGYIDRTGEFVIAPQFRYAEYFSDDMARVVADDSCEMPALSSCGYLEYEVPKPGDKPRCKYTFVNRAGIILAQQFDHARPFHDGVAPVAIEGRWGFIDKSGAFATPARYSEVGEFSEGLATASEDGKRFGYINRAGHWAVSPKFLDAGPFHEDRAVVARDRDEYYYITPGGDRAFKGTFYAATEFFKGIAQVRLDRAGAFHPGTLAYIDTSGHRIFSFATTGR